MTCGDDGAVTALNVDCKSKSVTTGGELPGADVWRGLPRLNWLDVNGCNLQGPLPPSLPASLEYLIVRTNNFTGSLPSTWSALTSLKKLEAGGNPNLGGTLPAAYSSMRALEVFAAWGCGLQGTLPASWSSMTALLEMYVHDNPELGGTLPDAWGSGMTSLVEFYAWDCGLRGTLPAAWSAMSSLVIFDVR